MNHVSCAMVLFVSLYFLPLALCGGFAAGAPGAVVVLAPGAEPGTRFAAEELTAILRRITGVAPEIVESTTVPDTVPVYLIGNHPANRALLDQLNARYPQSFDRFCWRVSGNRFQAVAPTADALAYAVWDWLEKQGNVGFLMPGQHGTYYPDNPGLRAEDGEYFGGPALEFRAYSTWVPDWQKKELEHGLPIEALFRYRQRFNMWTTLDTRDLYGWLGSGHAYGHYLPIDRYGGEHPEWYAMQNGVRRTASAGGFWQLCLTNPESPAVFAANAAPEIDALLAEGIPQDRILLCVVPNDMGGWCECPNCAAWRDPDGSWSSAVLHYTNAVADAVAKRYPGVKILHFVYHDYGRIPTRETPRPNVYACITAWSAMGSLAVDMTAGMFDPVKNPTCRTVFEWFNAHAAGVMSYGYYGHYEHFTPWPMIGQITSDIKTLAATPKGFGSYSESHQHWGTQAPNFYIHSKLMWDASRDETELLDEFCRKAYGPAGAEAARYFTTLQTHMESLPRICGVAAEIPLVMDGPTVAKCDALISNIEAKVPQMDADTAWRTGLLIDGWKMSIRYADAVKRLNCGTSSAERRLIAEDLDILEAFLATERGQVAFEPMLFEAALKQMRQAVGPDLEALPKGESRLAGHLMYGGALKFYARSSDMIPEMWGYYLPRGGTGELLVPLKSQPGTRLAKLEVRISGEAGTVALEVDGKAIPIRYDQTVKISLPEGGRGAVDLKFIFSGPSGQAVYALTGCDFLFTVE